MQDLLRKINLRELRLALLGIGAVITIAIAAGVVLPKFKSLQAAKKNVSVLVEASRDGAELDRHLEEKHAQLEALRYRLHGDMANLPARQVEAYIIGRLQKVSWNTNVELVSVQPADGELVQVFQEMLFKVELVGKYHDLYRWLWEARNDLGFVVVKELAFTRDDDNDDEPRLQANLNLASYRTIE